jgi:hypothetical protein
MYLEATDREPRQQKLVELRSRYDEALRTIQRRGLKGKEVSDLLRPIRRRALEWGLGGANAQQLIEEALSFRDDTPTVIWDSQRAFQGFGLSRLATGGSRRPKLGTDTGALSGSLSCT